MEWRVWVFKDSNFKHGLDSGFRLEKGRIQNSTFINISKMLGFKIHGRDSEFIQFMSSRAPGSCKEYSIHSEAICPFDF